MDQLIIHKKTGFKNLTPFNPIIIRDFRGIEFYNTSGLKKVDSFNLPVGYYYIDQGNIKELPKPVPVDYIEMPTIETWHKNPKEFNIYFSDNPNKCTVDFDSETIVFDHSFKNKPLPQIFFILYHEYGHQYYSTEKYADMYAANMMLKKGFNMSQIGASPLISLSERQYDRKQNLIERL